MTTDEQPRTGFTHPDQTGTWEPDWDHLAITVTARADASGLRTVSGGQMAEWIIAEYRRQQAERGTVEVGRARIDEVLGLLDALIPTANDEIDVDMLVTARDILAGTMSGLPATEQQ